MSTRLLTGSFVALITPFNKDGSVDFGAFRTLLKFHEGHGTAAVPWSSWNFSRVRNAPKSTEPSLLNGVMSATNEPVSSLVDIPTSNCRCQPVIRGDERRPTWSASIRYRAAAA